MKYGKEARIPVSVLSMKSILALLLFSAPLALSQPPVAPPSPATPAPAPPSAPTPIPHPRGAVAPLARPEPGWQARHARFNEISSKGEAPLVFLGDSITQGWEGAGKLAWEKHWAPLGAANF